MDPKKSPSLNFRRRSLRSGPCCGYTGSLELELPRPRPKKYPIKNSKVSSKLHKLSRISGGGNFSFRGFEMCEIITYDCALTALGVTLTLAQDLVAAALVDSHGTLGATVALFSEPPGESGRRTVLRSPFFPARSFPLITNHKNP